LTKYGSESNYFHTEGRVITEKDECEQIFMNYLEDHGVAEHAIINFTKTMSAPTSVTWDSSSKIKINIGLPIEYREGRI